MVWHSPGGTAGRQRLDSDGSAGDQRGRWELEGARYVLCAVCCATGHGYPPPQNPALYCLRCCSAWDMHRHLYLFLLTDKARLRICQLEANSFSTLKCLSWEVMYPPHFMASIFQCITLFTHNYPLCSFSGSLLQSAEFHIIGNIVMSLSALERG